MVVTRRTCLSGRSAYNVGMQAASRLWDQINLRADRVGERALRLLIGLDRFYRMMLLVLGHGLRGRWLRRPAVVNVVIRQIYFTGVQSVPWVVLMALAAGVLAVYNIVVFAKGLEDLSLIGRMVSGLLVTEVAPLFIAVFLLARSGVAVVTEVGSMHVRGEDILLRSLGISEHEYLYWPRVLAFSVCGLILTFIFVLVSIWIGGLVVAWSHALNFTDFLLEVRRGTSLAELLMMVGKGAFYPMLCALMLLGQASRVGRDPNLIPVRATQGVLGSLMAVVLVDVALVMAEKIL